MVKVNVATLKAELSHYLEIAESGEQVLVTSHGKEIAKIEQELVKVRAKLSSETFVSGAPAAVVEEHRKRETDWQSKLAEIRRVAEALSA